MQRMWSVHDSRGLLLHAVSAVRDGEPAMTNLVYRIQDNEGRGPWKPGFSSQWVIEREDLENLLPQGTL